MNPPRSVGRGGSGNFQTGPDETSGERDHRLSTAAKNNDSLYFGRGGHGNIEAAKALHREMEEERAKQEALAIEKARANAKAAAKKIQVPKPARPI